MVFKVVLGVFLLNSCTNGAPTSMERMTISKMRMADLETSASGYTYNQQQGHPVSYVQYTNHGSGRYYHAPDTVHYVVGVPTPVASAVPETAPRHQPTVLAYATPEHEILPYAEQQSYAKGEIGNYATRQLPKHASPLESIKLEPRAPYYDSLIEKQDAYDNGAIDENNETDSEDDSKPEEDADDVDHDDDADSDEDDDEEGEDDHEDAEDDDDEKDDSHHDYDITLNNFEFDGHDLKPFGGHQAEFPIKVPQGFGKPYASDDSSFEDAGGEKYDADEHLARGEEGEEDYKNYHEFSKGDHGEYDNGKSQGYFNIEGGQKKEDTDTAENYGQVEEEDKNEKDSSFGHASYHKKGEKTNGFHNVYHKDEYKKDTDFYDDEHKGGHFDKHGSHGEYHDAAEGGFKKGGRHSSGFDNEDKGKKGYYDKGHQEKHDQGYKTEEGEDSYYKNYEDYAKEADSNDGSAHEFSKGSGHH